MGVEALGPMAVEANILPNHETKVAVVIQAAAVVGAVAEGFKCCEEDKTKQNLAGQESQRSDIEATGYNRFANSPKHSGGKAWLLQKDMF